MSERRALSSEAVLGACWLACLGTWLLALFSTTVVVEAFPGTDFAVVEARSILGTIGFLFGRKLILVGVVLTSFSIVLPILKLLLQAWFVFFKHPPARADSGCSGVVLTLLTATSPYQMLDIYVGAYLIAFFNGHVTHARLGIGFYAFLVYCLMSIALFQALGADSPPPKETYDALAGESPPPSEEGLGKPSPRPVVCGVALAYLSFGAVSLSGDVLQVRCTFQGLVVDSTVASVLQVVLGSSSYGAMHPALGTLLLAFVVAVPAAFAVAVLVGELWRCAVLQAAMPLVQAWAMPDVFALAGLVFLLLAQDEDTLTTVPIDQQVPWATFCRLCTSGVAFAALRWELAASPPAPAAGTSAWSQALRASGRLAVALVVLAVAFWTAAHGSPTTKSWVADYPDFGSVCTETYRLLNAFMSRLPASVGQCSEGGPPQPCQDTGGPLYSGEELGFKISVPWVTGLDSLTVENCSVAQGETAPAECERRTGGQCRLLPCWMSGYPKEVVCENGECACPTGKCAQEDGSCKESQSAEVNATSREGKCEAKTGVSCMLWCLPWRNAQCVSGGCTCKTEDGQCAHEGVCTSQPSAPKEDGYRLRLLGILRELRADLDVKECGLSALAGRGCQQVLDSSDHCCGSNLHFRMEFLLPCERAASQHLPSIEVTVKILDPLWLDTSVLGKYDLTPVVEATLQSSLAPTLSRSRMQWGAKSLTLPQFLYQLVLNNIPRGKLPCGA